MTTSERLRAAMDHSVPGATAGEGRVRPMCDYNRAAMEH